MWWEEKILLGPCMWRNHGAFLSLFFFFSGPTGSDGATCYLAPWSFSLMMCEIYWDCTTAMCTGIHYGRCQLFVTFQTHNSSLFHTMAPFEPQLQSSFNLIFYSSVDTEARGMSRVSHIAYVLSWARGALLTAPLGICCPWPAYICILMHISCWDVNFRPSVIDGFHTSAESPLFPSPCRLLVYLCGLGVFQSAIVLLWRNYNRLKEREKRERGRGWGGEGIKRESLLIFSELRRGSFHSHSASLAHAFCY